MTRKQKQRTSPPKSRRLPAPHIPPGLRPLPPRQAVSPPDDHPYASRIVQLIEQMAAISGLSPYVLLRDWIGMLESGLKMWPANMRAMAIAGQFVEDPPEIQAIFHQARERYLRVSEQRPAVYRQMQAAFSEAFALLLDSATPDLEAFSRPNAPNPDVIGQVFTACLQPGPASPWWRYFPTWPTALAAARAALPEAGELVYLMLAEAAVQARAAGQTIELEPGVNFPAWFETVWPYVEPVIIGPPLVASGVELLAAAGQFPTWTVKSGLVKFTWLPEIDPLIQQLLNIDAMLFGLNGYIVAHYEALLDIEAHLLKQAETPPVTNLYQRPPAAVDPQTPEPSPDQAGQTFAELFRKKAKS